MMRRLSLPLGIALTLSLLGGGILTGETPPNDPLATPEFGELPAADPFDWSADLGTGVRSGSAIAAAFQASGVYGDVQTTVPHAVYWVQAYDEAAPQLGGHVFADPGQPNDLEEPATAFISDASLARFQNRVADIYDEVASADAEAGAGGFASESVVLDLWRLRRDWWVRWDGNLESDANIKGKGPYGMSREDMQVDILDQIEAVAQAQKPRYFIIGDEMDLLLKADEGDGFSQADYSNFMQFYRKAVALIKAQSPETKVGAGINWDRFVERVAPAYQADRDTSNEMILHRAFEATVLPFAEAGDIVALKSYRAPDDETIDMPLGEMSVTDSYQFLRRIEDLYGVQKPVVFYSIGTPVESPVSFLPQENFLQSFAGWIAGVEPEFVAWRFMANLPGSQSANQQLGGTCRTLTEEPYMMPVSTCYDGLIDAVYSTKEPFDYLVEQTQ